MTEPENAMPAGSNEDFNWLVPFQPQNGENSHIWLNSEEPNANPTDLFALHELSFLDNVSLNVGLNLEPLPSQTQDFLAINYTSKTQAHTETHNALYSEPQLPNCQPILEVTANKLKRQRLDGHINQRKRAKRPSPCIEAWAGKAKCTCDTGTCHIGSKLPDHIRIKVRFADAATFDKWAVDDYKKRLLQTPLRRFKECKLAALRHDPDGPILRVTCFEFTPEHSTQTQVFWKDKSGWKSITTSAYTLQYPDVDVAPYVNASIGPYLNKMSRGPGLVASLFAVIQNFVHEPIIHLCLQKYASIRHLMRGWSLCEDEHLEMTTVKEESPLRGTIPAPRTLQNQLDHRLELHVVDLENRILKDLQTMMLHQRREKWVVIFLAVFLLLHIQELDMWRLMYWIQHPPENNSWRHPSKPPELMQKSIHFTNMLMSHYRVISSGSLPIYLDWDRNDVRASVNYDPRIVQSLKELQLQQFEKWTSREIWREYREDNSDSIEFTISSLLVTKEDAFLEAKDFIAPKEFQIAFN